jgi:hypothetical protein
MENTLISCFQPPTLPVPVAAPSAAVRLLKLWVRIPPGAWMSVVSFVCVRKRSLPLADHSSREVLLTVMRRCVWYRNLVNEKALAHWGLSRQKQTNFLHSILVKQKNKCTMLERQWTSLICASVRKSWVPFATATEFCTVALDIRGSSVWDLLYVTLLGLLLDCCKTCARRIGNLLLVIW